MSQDFGSNPYQSPGASGNAASKVAGPAIGLIIAGVIDLLSALATAAYGVVLGNIDLEAAMPPGSIQGDPEAAKAAMAIVGPFYIGLGVVGVLVGAVIIFGGVKMKGLSGYGLAMTAAILAMIPGLSSCCLIGLPMGIWALVVLLNAEVKSAFR